MSCLGRWTWHQDVARSTSSGCHQDSRPCGEHMCSIIQYWPKDDDAPRLGNRSVRERFSVFPIPPIPHGHSHSRNLYIVKPIPIPVLFPKTHSHSHSSHSHFHQIAYESKQFKPDNVNVNSIMYYVPYLNVKWVHISDTALLYVGLLRLQPAFSLCKWH